MKTIAIRLILGIVIIAASIIGFFLFFDEVLNVHHLLDLKWFPLISTFIGFYLAGLLTQNVRVSWLPILFIALFTFKLMNFFHFPFVLLLILNATFGLMLSRNFSTKKIKFALWCLVICFQIYFLFSQPLIIQQKGFGYRTDGALVNAKKIWDFSKKEPNILPSEVFLDRNNEEVDLNQFEGNVLYIDFWATWCGPCLAEKPLIDSLKNKFSEHEKIVFIDISLDKDEDMWKAFINKEKPKGLQLISKNESQTRRNFKIMSLPHHIIVNASKNYKGLSFVPAAESYLNDLDALDKWIQEEQIIVERQD